MTVFERPHLGTFDAVGRSTPTPLFRRLTRGVELTEAGVFLLDEARRILDQVERAKAGVEAGRAARPGPFT